MVDLPMVNEPAYVASQNAAHSSPSATTVPLTLQAGWTLALLYGHIPQAPDDSPKKLPTVHELTPDERVKLELGRLNRILGELAARPEHSGSGLPTDIHDLGAIGSPEFEEKLMRFHLKVLDALATGTPEAELAYQLGRSLRDTVDPPGGTEDLRAPALARQLARGRIAQIKEWPATLSALDAPAAGSADVCRTSVSSRAP